MLFEKLYMSLLEDGVDINKMVIEMNLDIPARVPFWRAQFMSATRKRDYNRKCKEIYDVCIDNYRQYMADFWDDYSINEQGKVCDSSMDALPKLLATTAAIETIIANKIRTPLQWLRRWWHSRISPKSMSIEIGALPKSIQILLR